MTGTRTRPRASNRLLGILFVNLATFSWSTNIVLGRLLRDEIGPITLSALRFLLGAAIMAALLQRGETQGRRLGSDRWLVLLMGITGVALFAPTHYLGLRYTTALNTTLISALAPLLTGVLAALLIREPMSRFQAAGALVGLAGVLVLMSRGSADFLRTIGSSLGDAIILVAVLFWSLYTVVSRRVTARRPVLSATALSTLVGLPFLLGAMAWEWRALPPQFSPGLILAIVYIGIVPTVVGFLSWNAGVRRLGSSGAMVFYNTLPLYGVLLAAILLGEELGMAHLVGGGLIVGGGLWAARAQDRRRPAEGGATQRMPSANE
jgi:drug/metabolite transporter (DMT)-like permease